MNKELAAKIAEAWCDQTTGQYTDHLGEGDIVMDGTFEVGHLVELAQLVMEKHEVCYGCDKLFEVGELVIIAMKDRPRKYCHTCYQKEK